MKFEEALIEIEKDTTLKMTHAQMCSERHCYVRSQGFNLALKLVNFKTGLEQAWVPSPRDLLNTTWQVLEDK